MKKHCLIWTASLCALSVVAQPPGAHANGADAVPWAAADVARASATIDALIAQPLTADASVVIALLNAPASQAKLAHLGLAPSDLVQDGRLHDADPVAADKRTAHVTPTTSPLLATLAARVFAPLALDIEKSLYVDAKAAAAADIVGAAASARQAYIRAVAAQEMLAYFALVKESAEATSELARRMMVAGNWSKLAQMREQAHYADASAQLARAQHAALAEREQLGRMLGLSGRDRPFTLPSRLPDLPAALIEAADAERIAMERRIDVRLASLQGRVQAPEVANIARSEVREAHAAHRTAWELAKQYRDEILPLRRRIADENLLRYNGMLIGVFELLADAREQVASVNASIAATRDFWLADTALQGALADKALGYALTMGRDAAMTVAPAAAH